MKLVTDTCRYILKLEFNGSAYCGWQLQSEGPDYQGKHSIQYQVEQACATAIGRPQERLPVQGCSRTDAGVHAEEFYCHVDFPANLHRRYPELSKLKFALNGLLPKDIALIDILPCDKSFHALANAQFKIYEYRILLRRANPGLFQNRFLWVKHDLEEAKFNIEALQAGLQKFVGQHDFKAFASSKHTAKSTIRRLLAAELQLAPTNPHCQKQGHLLTLSFKGEGFLKQMVRNMVGFVIEIAYDQKRVTDIDMLLGSHNGQAQQRQCAGLCAPAHGLYLSKVHYENFPA